MNTSKTIVVVIFLLLGSATFSQDSTQLFIPAGKTVSEVLTPDKLYQHPEFVAGRVLYKNGTETGAFLNYNYLSGAIEFIGAKQDTLEISKDLISNIKKIIINGHTYFNEGGYLEQVDESAAGKLLKRQMYSLVKREKMGAYNQSSSLSAITSIGNISDNGSFSKNLKVNENITLALRSEYFIGDLNDNFLPVNKKNLIKTYPSKKRQIEDYLQQHPVDFKNLEDLKKLFSSL